MKNTVMVRGAAHFNMAGQFLHYPLHTIDENISAGLAERLRRYAIKRLERDGFEFAATWEAEVYTTDGDETPSKRVYCVKFQNKKGGYIEVAGILTNHGYPCLDHGFEIGQD